MKISSLKSLLTSAYTAKQPVMIWGAPGVGKSSAARQVADELSIEFIDLRLSLLESIDLRGLPVVGKGNKVEWAQPAFLPTKGKGILFLDEIVQASPSMQAAASQLILDRRIGEYTLPEGWVVFGAGNRKSDKSSANVMPRHIANRFVHVNVEVDVGEWVTWALGANVDVRVIAYMKWRPMNLHLFDTQQKGEAFASPRSWEFASKMLGANLPDSLLLESMQGCVGEGCATEFVGFLRVCDKLPSLDAILRSPKEAPLPDDLATTWAVASNLIYAATKENIGKVVTYLSRLVDAGRPEMSVFAQKELGLKQPALCNTRAFIEWSTINAPFIA